MASVNKAIIVGNIGRDPVVRNFANGKVVQFSVATSKKYRDAIVIKPKERTLTIK